MYTKDDVARLIAEIAKRKAAKADEHTTTDLSALEIGTATQFGLAVDVFDPGSGQVMTICQPHRVDIAQPEIFLTADQVAVEVMQARSRRVRHDRAHGLVPPPAPTKPATPVAATVPT